MARLGYFGWIRTIPRLNKLHLSRSWDENIWKVFQLNCLEACTKGCSIDLHMYFHMKMAKTRSLTLKVMTWHQYVTPPLSQAMLYVNRHLKKYKLFKFSNIPTGTEGNCSTCFLSLARKKLRLCSANHRADYFSNLACDWLSIVWAYSKQESENGLRSISGKACYC